MLALFRSIVYVALFISVFLVFIPEQILTATGITRPSEIAPLHWVGLALVVLGGALAIWCVLTLALVGKGTPAPFDPPRKLVAAGPYRWVRNPMYVGAGTALFGAAVFYQSPALVAFAAGFLVMAHLFVVFYEEPTLARTFGARYADYRNAVPRWMPTWRS
ncbi:MAG TPA: PEMT/PEM2 methyltransferase family protein [Vicinamibacterales bacterium]|jgi:protein-S-isoprenylcysteine O-methyltransferase Ste14